MANHLRVRHWALLTVLLYGAACVVLTGPLLFGAFSWGGDPPERWDVFKVYETPHYWLIVNLLMLLQSLFLLLPIDVARERPVPRRRWVIVAAAAALMMGVLTGGLVCAVGEAIFQSEFVDRPSGFLWALVALIVGWFHWTIVFITYASSKDPKSLCHLLVTRLLGGSVAELLVAIPCHVYVRSKEYCCAGFPTAIGLMAGLAVLLFAFGPGVLFLFVARARRLRGKVQEGVAATQAKDQTKPRTPHARDALVWLALALGFLVLAGLNVLVFRKGHWTAPDWSVVVRSAVCFVAFLVFAGMSVWRTWCAAREAEPPSFSRQAEAETHRYSPHARNVAVWLALALGFLVLAGVNGSLFEEAHGRLPHWPVPVFSEVCFVSFWVLAGMVVWRAWCAVRQDEPLSFSTQAEAETRRYSPHARDAAVWLSVGLGFFLLREFSSWMPDAYDASVLSMVCSVAFLVLACMAVWRTWSAVRAGEPRSFGMVAVLLALCAAILLALCLLQE